MKFLQGLFFTLWVFLVVSSVAFENGNRCFAQDQLPTPISASDISAPDEVIAPGWERSYQAGYLDDNGKYVGGSEILHLVAHKGKLFAAVGYWMDKRNIWYGGSSADTGWAQVLRLDGPDARWQVDLEMPWHLRCEILQSVTFTTDSEGKALPQPVNLLLASTYMGDGKDGVSLFTRDDATGRWEQSKIISGPTGKDGVGISVRAMQIHHDRVTGVDRVFISIGELGIFSGVYDPALPGKIRWDAQSESGPVDIRPLAVAEANGTLVFSTGKSIFCRIDGKKSKYVLVHDLGNLLSGKIDPSFGGIHGLTPIPNPTGSGQSLLFCWAPNEYASIGCIMRLDPDGKGGYTQIQEVFLDKLVRQYLDGIPVDVILAGYNNILPIKDPATQETNYLVGMIAGISGKRFPATNNGVYAGALYAIRDSKGGYRISEVNGRISSSNPPLVATRCYALSPFKADNGKVIYFGGYDGSFILCSNTAWIFRTNLANALRHNDSKQ